MREWWWDKIPQVNTPIGATFFLGVIVLGSILSGLFFWHGGRFAYDWKFGEGLWWCEVDGHGLPEKDGGHVEFVEANYKNLRADAEKTILKSELSDDFDDYLRKKAVVKKYCHLAMGAFWTRVLVVIWYPVTFFTAIFIIPTVLQRFYFWIVDAQDKSDVGE